MFTFTIARSGERRVLRISALLSHFPNKRYAVKSSVSHLELLPVEVGGYARTIYHKKGSMVVPIPSIGFPSKGFHIATVQATLNRNTGNISLPHPEYWTARTPKEPFKKPSSRQQATNGLFLEHIKGAVTLLNKSHKAGLQLSLDEEGKLHATIEI
jgi:hypothetical protein